MPITATPNKSTPVSRLIPNGGALRRKCACGGTLGPTGECETCRKEKLQRRSENLDLSSISDPPSPVSEVPRIVDEALRSPGQPLDHETRAFMEPRFGHDFGDVRVHTDGASARSAEAVNALAYTVGNQVVFDAGRYQPATTEGQGLLAHELAHVVQQNNNLARKECLAVAKADDAAEQEADKAARAILSDQRTVVRTHCNSPIVQRQLPSATTFGVTPVAPQTGVSKTPGPQPILPTATTYGVTPTGGDAQGQTEAGGLCFRTPFPPGQIRFEGCSGEQLARYLIFPEHGDKIIYPAANTWHDGDGVWSMDHTPADEWFKVPSHCDMTLRCSGQSFSGTSCCNAAASLLKGKPRWVNDGHDAKKNLPKSPP